MFSALNNWIVGLLDHAGDRRRGRHFGGVVAPRPHPGACLDAASDPPRPQRSLRVHHRGGRGDLCRPAGLYRGRRVGRFRQGRRAGSDRGQSGRQSLSRHGRPSRSAGDGASTHSVQLRRDRRAGRMAGARRRADRGQGRMAAARQISPVPSAISCVRAGGAGDRDRDDPQPGRALRRAARPLLRRRRGLAADPVVEPDRGGGPDHPLQHPVRGSELCDAHGHGRDARRLDRPRSLPHHFVGQSRFAAKTMSPPRRSSAWSGRWRTWPTRRIEHPRGGRRTMRRFSAPAPIPGGFWVWESPDDAERRQGLGVAAGAGFAGRLARRPQAEQNHGRPPAPRAP